MSEVKYNTNQRRLILDFLEENSGRHVTADDALFALKARGCPVGKATIYRFFDKLAKEGKLLKYSAVDGAGACYEYNAGHAQCSGHYHLKCDGCGALLHLECSSVAKLYEHMRGEHGFQVDNRQTVFYGKCSACVEREDV